MNAALLSPCRRARRGTVRPARHVSTRCPRHQHTRVRQTRGSRSLLSGHSPASIRRLPLRRKAAPQRQCSSSSFGEATGHVFRSPSGCANRTHRRSRCWRRAAFSSRTSATVTRRSRPTARSSSRARPKRCEALAGIALAPIPRRLLLACESESRVAWLKLPAADRRLTEKRFEVSTRRLLGLLRAAALDRLLPGAYHPSASALPAAPPAPASCQSSCKRATRSCRHPRPELRRCAAS